MFVFRSLRSKAPIFVLAAPAFNDSLFACLYSSPPPRLFHIRALMFRSIWNKIKLSAMMAIPKRQLETYSSFGSYLCAVGRAPSPRCTPSSPRRPRTAPHARRRSRRSVQDRVPDQAPIGSPRPRRTTTGHFRQTLRVVHGHGGHTPRDVVHRHRHRQREPQLGVRENRHERREALGEVVARWPARSSRPRSWCSLTACPTDARAVLHHGGEQLDLVSR